jgi:hypothetical protein
MCGLDTYDRVQSVIHFLRDAHRWSFKDFIYFYATAPAEKRYTMSRKMRVRRLAEALDKKELLAPLFDRSSVLYESAIPFVINNLHAEVEALCKPNTGLGEFDSDTPVHNLDISSFSRRIRTAAPNLYRLLLLLMGGEDSDKTSDKYGGAIFLLCSVIVFQASPINGNQFPTLLGVYTHSMGAKRRLISVLAGLGIIPSYRTIMRRLDELAGLGKVPSLSCTSDSSLEYHLQF